MIILPLLYILIFAYYPYKDIEWSVNDETIAIIDENGVLTANATGTITIIAKAKSGVTSKQELPAELNEQLKRLSFPVTARKVWGGKKIPQKQHIIKFITKHHLVFEICLSKTPNRRGKLRRFLVEINNSCQKKLRFS